MARPEKFAIIGFGEVGQLFAKELLEKGANDIAVYDIQFDRPESIPSRALGTMRVRAGTSAADAAKGADIVIACVTAADTENAARSAAPGTKGAFYLDLNSASPGMKRAASSHIEKAGGRYVEAAVMTPVHPRGIGSPMLLGGPNAEDFLAHVEGIGFAQEFFSPELGKASAAKMCRSVMIKGIEALITESLLSARELGVEKHVLASLGNTVPIPNWEKFAHYFLTRSLQHGKRRAEEMREVARTVAEAGVNPRMSTACAERQDETYTLGRDFDPEAITDLTELIDAVRARMNAAKAAAQ